MPEPFTASDGDGWYQRNADYLTRRWRPETDWPCRLLEMYGVRPKVAVESGCASGYRLAHLSALHPHSRCIGVDISEQAIAEGRKRHPELELRVADANHLPVADGLADVAICYFVFHWLSREYVFLAASEAARVVKPGGVVILGDFAPDCDETVSYKHRIGVQTYKRRDSYAGLFLDPGDFDAVAHVTWNHDTHEVRPDVPSEQRAACWLLRKEQ